MAGSATEKPRSLNRGAIVAVARRVADSEGLTALTLRRIGAELGTGQASLYRHIADRAELLSLLVDDLAAGFALVTADATPSAAVLQQWQAMHDHLAAHPWGARLIAGGTHLADGAEHIAEHAIAQLQRAGLPAEDADRGYRSLWHLLLGHLLNEHPLGHGASPATGVEERRATGQKTDFGWALRRLLEGMLLASNAATASPPPH
jgi:AcrR family transcriptional regulator